MSRGPEGPGGPNQNEPKKQPMVWSPSLFLVHGPPMVFLRLCINNTLKKELQHGYNFWTDQNILYLPLARGSLKRSWWFDRDTLRGSYSWVSCPYRNQCRLLPSVRPEIPADSRSLPLLFAPRRERHRPVRRRPCSAPLRSCYRRQTVRK